MVAVGLVGPLIDTGRVKNRQRAEMVEPGWAIKRTFEDPRLGRVEFGFRAL